MSSNPTSSGSGWGGCFGFAVVLGVVGVLGCVLGSEEVINLLDGHAGAKPPLALTVRDSTGGNGKVLRITNTSDGPIHQVRLLLPNRQDHYEKVIADTIQPHDTIEIGPTESGLALEKGMLIELRANGYGGSFRDKIL